VKRYTMLSKNFFRQLARGEAVSYFEFFIEATDEKIIVRAPDKDGSQVEFHYRRKAGELYGFSKDQLASIFAGREKPVYTIRLKAAR
jgi:hypothetical protein